MMRAMADGGADVIEIGVPFSDPMADGPVIQRAGKRALRNGMTLRKSIDAVAEYRERANGSAPPVVLMGYANSFLNHPGGVSGFAEAAGRAGVSGLIVVDLADSARAAWRGPLNDAGIDMINLVAPTTAPERLRMLAAETQGFLYAIALKGVTGAAHLDARGTAAQLTDARRFSSAPVAAGFGVRVAADAIALAGMADGVVVGSRLVEIAEEAADGASAEAVRDAVREFAEALKT